MSRANEAIRKKAQEHGVKLWEIAELMHITDGNFSRKLRHELSGTEKERVFQIIEQIAADKNAG